MKIGITCYPTYGGSGSLATDLGLHLARRGHEIHFISYSQPFRLQGYQERVYFHEASVGHYPLFEYPPYTLALASRMAEVAAQHELDLLHVHYALPHAVSAYLARQLLARTPPALVTTLHGTDITLLGSAPAFFPMIKFSIEQSDRVTCVSDFLANETRRVFGVTQPLDVIHNFVDTEIFTPRRLDDDARRLDLAPAGVPIIMHLSNFRPVKRLPDVIAAFARVRRQRPARLVLVGDGPDRPTALAQAEALGVHRDVVALGRQDAVENLLKLADVFLLPSETESFGLAALEAMASGVPVVASRVGGLPEVVEDGVCGLLVPPGDVDGLAHALERLLANPALRSRMGAAARDRAIGAFDAGLIVPRYEALYQTTLEQHAKQPGRRPQRKRSTIS